MEAKWGKKRALEADGSQGENGEMAGMVGQAPQVIQMMVMKMYNIISRVFILAHGWHFAK